MKILPRQHISNKYNTCTWLLVQCILGLNALDMCITVWIGRSNLNIYIFIAIALDETSIFVAVYFSMQNIYRSCDLGRALGHSNVDVSQ